MHVLSSKSKIIYLVDVITHAGYKVFWIDNASDCKDMCSRVEIILIPSDCDKKLCDGHFYIDEVVLNALTRIVSKINIKHNNFIILHLSGSHDSTYHLKYHYCHEIFTPACNRSDIENCTLIMESRLVKKDYICMVHRIHLPQTNKLRSPLHYGFQKIHL